MKAVSPQQMADMESMAYRDGALESEFMEEAGSGVALAVHEYVEKHDLPKQAVLLCGKGNNSGDAYVAGVDLLHLDYTVTALQITPIEEASPLCRQNHARFLQEGGVVKDLGNTEEISLSLDGIVVDGLFGTGFHGPLEEPFISIVNAINDSDVPVISIDIPSGLNGESGIAEGAAIQATETAFLGLPKLGFFLNDGWNHIGKLRYIDFGLGDEYIDEVETSVMMLTRDMIKPYMPPLVRDRHKYQAGYVVGIAGSPGMAGAAILAGWSALCSGAGIVRVMHPPGMEQEMASSPYELIKTAYHSPEDIFKELDRASAVFIGPGMGTDDRSMELLKAILPRIKVPCVLDADALTLIAQAEISLPAKTILTPHHGEMGRLLHEPAPKKIDRDFLEKCRSYAAHKGITLILKGGPSFVLQADEPIYVNPLGDPGMATAGSGDVLTGLVASLLAQGVPPLHAATVGIYIHGFSGECAATTVTSYCMTASDIIQNFPNAFHVLGD